MIYKTTSALETKKLAADLVKKLIKTKPQRALILALTGELGSSKTTFVQGFLRALGIKSKITSPTFVLIKKYKIRTSKSETNSKFKIQNSKFEHAYHIDCYRIKKPGELLKLDLKEILKNPQNIVLIEWAEKIKRILPKNTIWISFSHGKKESERVLSQRRYWPIFS